MRGKPKRVGVLELIASTAALNDRLTLSFWAELSVKRQFYSVMPQAVSVWARQSGHQVFYATYSGIGRPDQLLPDDLDFVFISAPTQHCALACALAKIFRANGARIILGGPHARAYPQDCARFADIVVSDCDKLVIMEILAAAIDPGSIVKSKRPLRELPLVEERAPEIRAAAFVNGRQIPTTVISLISSLGCPYACDFCSEWQTPYLAFETERLRQELGYIKGHFPGALIAFHDPNFAVKFDQTLSAFDQVGTTRSNPFVMESTLSLLNGPRLKRLRDAGCIMVAPGIESWADYSNKSRTTRIVGEEKYRSISAKLREIEGHIPTVQANIILGVDADAGDEPFALTLRFIREHPKTWTNVNIPIPFGETPFAKQVRSEGRLVERLPLALYTAPYLALKPRNYTVQDYLRRLTSVYEAMTAPRLLMRRLRVLPSGLARSVAIGRTLALKVELRELRAFRAALNREPDLRQFYENSKIVGVPNFFVRRVRKRLGIYSNVLSENELRPYDSTSDKPTPVTLI